MKVQKKNTLTNFFESNKDPMVAGNEDKMDQKSDEPKRTGEDYQIKDDTVVKVKQKKQVKIVLPGESSDGPWSEQDQSGNSGRIGGEGSETASQVDPDILADVLAAEKNLNRPATLEDPFGLEQYDPKAAQRARKRERKLKAKDEELQEEMED